MKVNFTKLKDLILLEKYRNLTNLRKLGFVLGISNIFNFLVFYIWFFIYSNNKSVSTITNLLIFSAILHFYTSIIFIRWSLPYEESKLLLWGWLSMVFVSPAGIGLLFICSSQGNWNMQEKKTRDRQYSFAHSFTNSFINLDKNLEATLKSLQETHPKEIIFYLKEILKIKSSNINTWSNKQKFSVLALQEALRQTKKKNTFNDFVFNAKWYEKRYFDFAVKDPKSEIMPVKYIYTMAFIVLDEFNNYKKIVEGKKEIKNNIKFGPSKIICIHWGKGYKIYVNE